MSLVRNICNLCGECSQNRQLHYRRAWCRWSCGISSLNQITLIFEIVTFILCKRVNRGYRENFMKPSQRMFSKQAAALLRAWCRWSRAISSLNQITLIFEIVTFFLCKRVNHGFRQKFTKPLQRVFSKQATPHGESMASLELWYILIKPNKTHI